MSIARSDPATARPDPPALPGAPRRARRPRPQRPRPRSAFVIDSPAIRAGLTITAIVIVAILVYLVTLTARPTISHVTPAPNSETPPGIVSIAAQVDAGRPIQQVRLLIDGEETRPAVQVRSPRSWAIQYQTELAPGRHEATVIVVDSSGEMEEHAWSFVAAGPRIEPDFAIAGPPPGATIGPGTIRLRVEVVTATDITHATLIVDDTEIPTTFRPLRAGTAQPNGGASLQQRWEVLADQSLSAGPHRVELSITDRFGDTAGVSWSFQVASRPEQVTVRFFPETNQYVAEPFRSFWEENNGERLFGNPVGPELVTNEGRRMQYFEYARLELGDDGVVLGLLGHEALGAPMAPVENPRQPGTRYFPETGHTLSGPFRAFWEENGGLPIFGFPISEIIQEGGTRVQYFERARFELVAGEGDQTAAVRLTPLGELLWQARLANRE